MSLSIDNTDHTAKGEDNRIQALTDALEGLQGGTGMDVLGIGDNASTVTDVAGVQIYVGADPTTLPTEFQMPWGNNFTVKNNPNGSTALFAGGFDDTDVGTAEGAQITAVATGEDSAAWGVTVNCYGKGAGVVDVRGVQVAVEDKSPDNGGTISAFRASAAVTSTGIPANVYGYWVPGSFGGLGSGSNIAVYLANQGSGANDFAIKTDGGRVCHNNTPVPASASAAGTQGEIAWDSGFIYICIATNTWKKAALSSW